MTRNFPTTETHPLPMTGRRWRWRRRQKNFRPPPAPTPSRPGIQYPFWASLTPTFTFLVWNLDCVCCYVCSLGICFTTCRFYNSPHLGIGWWRVGGGWRRGRLNNYIDIGKLGPHYAEVLWRGSRGAILEICGSTRGALLESFGIHFARLAILLGHFGLIVQ